MHRAVILTALPVEYLSVRTHLANLREDIHPNGTVYERGIFSAGSLVWDVGIVEIGAGNTGAALEAERAIAYFNPDVILFVEVAGGIKDVALGNVVASTKVYGYESGRVKQQFKPRPEIGSSAYSLIQRAIAEARNVDWLKRLAVRPKMMPLVYVAPIAAGEKVMASTKSEAFKFLREYYEDAIAVEMEGFGFLKAAQANPKVAALVVRGISDLIDDKSEVAEPYSQKIASQHASAFAFQILATLRPPIHINNPSIPIFTVLLKQISQLPLLLPLFLLLSFLGGTILGLMSPKFRPIPLTVKPPEPGIIPSASSPNPTVKYSKSKAVPSPTQLTSGIIESPPIVVGEPNQEIVFRLYILSNNYSWKYGSSMLIHYQGEDEKMKWLEKELTAPAIQKRWSQMVDIISVGTASCEGSSDEEKLRANDRAIELHRTIQKVPISTLTLPGYHKLSFGQSKSSKCEKLKADVNPPKADEDHLKTAVQRRILILGVESKKNDEIKREDIVAALKKLENSKQLDFLIQDYSNPDLSY